MFPGLGLGVTVAKASRISDRMIAAAADAVAQLSDATKPGRAAAAADDATCARCPPRSRSRWRRPRRPRASPSARSTNPIQQVHHAMWRPEYPRIEVKPL